MRIIEYLKSENYKKILEIAKELIDVNHLDDYLLYYQALAEYKLGNYNQSLKHLDLVLAAEPQCKLTNLFSWLDNTDE